VFPPRNKKQMKKQRKKISLHVHMGVVNTTEAMPINGN